MEPQMKAFERPTVAYYLAQKVIAARQPVSDAQRKLAMAYVDSGLYGDANEFRRMSEQFEDEWGTSVYEACKQALHHQDELIAELQELLTDQVMLQPPAPIIVEREGLQAMVPKQERRWFGDPLSAFCGGVIGFILAALLACIIWRLSV